MTIKKLLLAAVFTALAFFISAAQQVFDSASNVFSFMNIGMGARATGMGGAFAAVPGDLNSVYWNPAGLSSVKSAGIGLSYGQMFVDSSYQYLLGGTPMGPGAVGINISYLRYGSFELRDAGGVVLSNTVNPYNMAAMAAYGMPLMPGFSVGAAVKYLNQDVNGSKMTGYAFDLGALGEMGIFSAGVTAQNLGTAGDFSMPINIRAGLAARLTAGDKNVFIVAGDFSYPLKGSTSMNLGAEYSWADMIKIRCGYSFKDENNSLKGMSGLSGGLGIKLGQTAIDYSMVPYGDLGTVNNFTLSYDFGQSDPKDTQNKN